MTYSATDLRKLVGKSAKGHVVRLSVNKVERDGVWPGLWATNSYWAVPAQTLGLLAQKDHADLSAPVVYESYVSLAHMTMDPPNIDVLLNADGYEPIAPTMQDGSKVFRRFSTGDYVAMFGDVDGQRLALNADFEAFCRSVVGKLDHYGQRWSDPIWTRLPGANARPMMLTALCETAHGGNNGPDGKWIPQTWAPEPRVVVAVCMPVRTS